MYHDNFYKTFLNESINPFMLFSNDGKLIDFNYEAEILFNDISPKDLFELALSNSSHNFGFNRKYINLQFGKAKYYAILVGYIDDEKIGIELYKQINMEKEIGKIEGIELTNIFSLIEISKATNFDYINTNILEEYDTSIPEIKVNINNFLLTLNEFFKLFKESKTIELSVKIKVGEFEIIDGKKHSIIYISCKGDVDMSITTGLEIQALKSHINVFEVDKTIAIEFPMIL